MFVTLRIINKQNKDIERVKIRLLLLDKYKMA